MNEATAWFYTTVRRNYYAEHERVCRLVALNLLRRTTGHFVLNMDVSPEIVLHRDDHRTLARVAEQMIEIAIHDWEKAGRDAGVLPWGTDIITNRRG